MTNEALEVLEFLGDTSPYLHLMPGKATLNLRKILTPLLYREVLGAVKKTARARVARRPGVSLLLGTGRTKINIEVTRLKNNSAGEIRYRILLEEVSPLSGKSAKAKHKPKAEQTEEPEAARLKQELAATKESLSAILAEQDQGHQATLKELGASHEEAQTIAARLEVMNAELEASQAELEETAEELRVALAASERHGQESEGRVRALLESAAQGIVAVERGGRIGLVNGTAEKMFGYGREELLGQPVEMLLPDNFRSAHRRHRREFFAHPRTRPMGQGLDLFARRKDGTTFPVEVSLSHIEPESDTVAAAFISDITERKRAEEDFREEHAFNTALVHTVRALVVVLDREGRIVRFNKACQEITGYSFEDVQGRRVWELLLVPEEVAPVKRVFGQLLAGQSPNQFENYWVTKNGEQRLISWSNTVLPGDNGIVDFVIGTGLDITKQRQMAETIRQSHNDLRKLTARLISAQEGAYRRLARELHDGFSQKLAILGMHVSELERKLLAAGMPMEEGLKPIGEEISGLASEIHGISRRLHPVILDDLGLAVALKNECLAFSREHGIKVEFHAGSIPLSLSNDVALCLYRIAQEGLNNIQKHAETSEARVTLAGHPGEIVLSVEDAGKGFQPEKVRGKGGLGLVSMEERIRLVDGKLTIQSKPGDGTTIQVRVPLRSPGSRRGKQ